MTKEAARTSPAKPLKICLINPKFDPSFWGYDYVLPLVPGDKRCWTVTGALPTLAGLAPDFCDMRLLDENVEPINYEALGGFDVIGVTGMIVQARRMIEILNELKALPATVVVGGPYVSVAEDMFAGLYDACFIGEAEETWPAFLRAFAAGEPTATRYQQADKTDMRTVPPPRYDLVKSDRYMMASLQFSRGCPFLCEFCDIITIFGRRPRLKTPEQMIVAFEEIRRAGFRLCFLVRLGGNLVRRLCPPLHRALALLLDCERFTQGRVRDATEDYWYDGPARADGSRWRWRTRGLSSLTVSAAPRRSGR